MSNWSTIRSTTKGLLPLTLGLFSARVFASLLIQAPDQQPAPPDYSVTVFGSVAPNDGLRGLVYELVPGTRFLPNLDAMHPVTTLYTKTLNIPPQYFRIGIPGVSRIEWFAIDYTGNIWISRKGTYEFQLQSDDGARLFLDGKEVINNDGIHSPSTRSGEVDLKTGPHSFRVAYFQGPRENIALVLAVKGPRGGWRIFNTDDFRQPTGKDKAR